MVPDVSSGDGMARLRLFTGYAIVLTFVVAFCADLISPAIRVEREHYVLMAIVAGALFAPSIAGRNGRQDG